MERSQSLGTKYIPLPTAPGGAQTLTARLEGPGKERKGPGCKGAGGEKEGNLASKRKREANRKRERRAEGGERRKWGSGWSQLVGITALRQKGAPFRPEQPSTGLGRDAQAEPALGPDLRGAGRPLLAAGRRSRRSSGCSGPAPPRPPAPGTWRWCREEGRETVGGVRVLRRRAGSPPRTLLRGLLTWGLQDSFPADAAPARPSAARLPHHSKPAEHPALLAERSRSQPQQLGGRERPPAAAGRRLGAASRARRAAIWSLSSGRRCGYKGRGLAARPEARKGPGSERGSGCLGVWGEDVCEELWPLGRRNRRLPPLSARNSGAVLTGRSNRKSGGARVAVHPPTSYFALAGGELCVCVCGGEPKHS